MVQRWFHHGDIVSRQVDLYMTTVKIGLKQEEEEGVVTEVLLDSGATCYDLKLKMLSNKTTLVLSNTRELDRVLDTK